MTESQINTVFGAITTGGLNTATEALACWNALKGELFPTPVTIEWDGSAETSSNVNISVSSGINTGVLSFIITFWKSGNTVYCNGEITPDKVVIINPKQLCDFDTSLYRPLSVSTSFSEIAQSNGVNATSPINKMIKISSSGLNLMNPLPSTTGKYVFESTYKVAN